MIQVQRVLRVILARRVRRETLDPQAIRVQREIQVQQDLSVIQAQREILDRRVLQVTPAQPDRKEI